MSIETRITAAAALARVTDEGGYSQRVLAAAFERQHLAPRDRGWVTRAVYGTLTALRRVDLALDRLLDRGIDSVAPELRAHLRVAIWEIGVAGGIDNPGPLVSAAVDAIRADGMPRQTRLANGVLRSLVRDFDIVFNPPKRASDNARVGLDLGLPDWMVERLRDVVEDGVADVMAGFNAVTPVGFRVRQGARDALLAELAAEGLEVSPHPLLASAGVCTKGNVAASAAHQRGAIAIQDAGAQLAVAALPDDLEGPILDAAAGIGGKTRALADRFGAARVMATDTARQKLTHLRALDGLDGVKTARWRIGASDRVPNFVQEAAPFGAVVLDAPCSALGTMGRHPEVRWNRAPELIAEMAAQQRVMLDALAPLVAPGGWLLYVVCTWTPEETLGAVRDFIGAHPAFALSAPTADSAASDVDWGSLVDDAGGIQLWPQASKTDGFYIARMRRDATD